MNIVYPTFINLVSYYTDLVFLLAARDIRHALNYERFYNSIRVLNHSISAYRGTAYTMHDFISECNQDSQYHMMFDKETIVGFCKTETTLKNRLYLYSYLIHPHYRGKGYNRFFMNGVCTNLKQCGHDTVELKVHEDNLGAYNGYIHSGFQLKDKQNKRYFMERLL
jgi:ribosomal protein S18 acetylase RimI-like enzyme